MLIWGLSSAGRAVEAKTLPKKSIEDEIRLKFQI